MYSLEYLKGNTLQLLLEVSFFDAHKDGADFQELLYNWPLLLNVFKVLKKDKIDV